MDARTSIHGLPVCLWRCPANSYPYDREARYESTPAGGSGHTNHPTGKLRHTVVCPYRACIAPYLRPRESPRKLSNGSRAMEQAGEQRADVWSFFCPSAPLSPKTPKGGPYGIAYEVSMSRQHRLSCAVPSIDFSQERSLTTYAQLQHRVHDFHTCDESEQRQSLGQLGQSDILPHPCVLPDNQLITSTCLPMRGDGSYSAEPPADRGRLVVRCGACGTPLTGGQNGCVRCDDSGYETD